MESTAKTVNASFGFDKIIVSILITFFSITAGLAATGFSLHL